MTRSRKAVLVACSVPLAGLATWLVYHETRIPRNQGEVLDRMIELQREGRYDKAVEVVQKWMHDGRRNTANDDFMYGQIALVYIMKAYKKPGFRADSIAKAEENLEKELDLFDKQNHDELSVDLFGIGGGYEILADLSDKDKCRFYGKARQALERQLPLIKGDSYTAYSHTTPLEPVRADVRNHLNAVNEKSAKVGCPVSTEK